MLRFMYNGEAAARTAKIPATQGSKRRHSHHAVTPPANIAGTTLHNRNVGSVKSPVSFVVAHVSSSNSTWSFGTYRPKIALGPGRMYLTAEKTSSFQRLWVRGGNLDQRTNSPASKVTVNGAN